MLLKGHRNSHFHQSRWFGCLEVVVVVVVMGMVMGMMVLMMVMVILMGQGD